MSAPVTERVPMPPVVHAYRCRSCHHTTDPLAPDTGTFVIEVVEYQCQLCFDAEHPEVVAR